MFAARQASILVSLIVPELALAAEPVEVWLTPPSISHAREIGELITEASKVGLRASEERWLALNTRDLSYVLEQFTTGILTTDCDMEPVSVRIRGEGVVSATYAVETKKCHKGAVVKEPQYSQKILAPKDIFDIAKSEIAANRECGVKVTYDEATGLPSLIEGGCWFIPDTYWSIKVRDLRFHK